MLLSVMGLYGQASKSLDVVAAGLNRIGESIAFIASFHAF